MKPFFSKPVFSLLGALALLLANVLAAHAQSPPGWGWVNQLGTYTNTGNGENNVAGLGRDAAGNLYLLGTYVGSPTLSGVPVVAQGGTDIFLAKYNPVGTLLWLRLLQSSGSDVAAALAVEPSGRCTLAGYYGGMTGDNLSFGSFNATTPPLPGPALLGLAAPGGFYGSLTFVAAVDANGALLWADTPSPAYGGVNVTALHRDGIGNCYVSANAGSQAQLIVGGQNYPAIGSSDAVLLKYASAGQVAWARRLGASGGFTYGGDVKTDAANALYWSVNHNRSLLIDSWTAPFVTPSNPVTQGSNSLVKISAVNAVRWVKNSLLKSGNTNALGSVVYIDQASSTMYLTGGSFGGTVTDQNNAFGLTIPANSYGTCIARCDTSGAVQWVRPFAFASTVAGGASWAAVGIMNFFPDTSGYTALTNTAYAARTVFPPNNTFDSGRSGLPCVVRFSYATNQFDWIRVGGASGAFGGSVGSNAVAGAMDGTGNVYVAGTFTGPAQFGAITLTSASSTQPEIFLAKLDQTIPTGTKAAAQGQSWSVYPNPTAGTVHLLGLPAPAQVRVYDAQGRLVRTLPPVSTADAPRTFSGLSPGLYLLQVSHTAKDYRSQRLVVQ